MKYFATITIFNRYKALNLNDIPGDCQGFEENHCFYHFIKPTVHINGVMKYFEHITINTVFKCFFFLIIQYLVLCNYMQMYAYLMTIYHTYFTFYTLYLRLH